MIRCTDLGRSREPWLAPKRFYCTLDGDCADPPNPWQALSTVTLFRSWCGSTHSHAAWLAGEITELLSRWDAEANGLIGATTGWYVPDLVSRRAAAAIDNALRASHDDGSMAQPLRTNGGNPMFMAWRRHPHGSPDAWLAVDVRCEGRGGSSQSWVFRPCVDIYADDSDTARLEAHDLAVALKPAMTLPAVQSALVARGHRRLAHTLSAKKLDGLRSPADPEDLAAWRAQVAAGRNPDRHPVFFRDRKHRRLATLLRADVTRLTFHDLAELSLAVLDHLVDYATAHPPEEQQERAPTEAASRATP